MDGLGRAVAADVPVRLGGRTYLMVPLRLRDLGTVEHYLLSLAPDPLDIAAAAAPRLEGYPDLQDGLLDLARRDLRCDRRARQVTGTEVLQWIDTADGLVFTAWLALRPRHPEMFATLDQAAAFFAGLPPADWRAFKRQRDRAAGLDLAALLDWPADDGGRDGEGRDAPRPMPWRRVVRKFGEAFWPPWVLGELTLYQFRIFQAREAELGGEVTVTVSEGLSLWKAQKERREREAREADGL